MTKVEFVNIPRLLNQSIFLDPSLKTYFVYRFATIDRAHSLYFFETESCHCASDVVLETIHKGSCVIEAFQVKGVSETIKRKNMENLQEKRTLVEHKSHPNFEIQARLTFRRGSVDNKSTTHKTHRIKSIVRR